MDYNIKIILKHDMNIIAQLVNIERQAFGEYGMDETEIVPLLRYGRVFVAVQDDKEILAAAYFMRCWDEPYKAYILGVAVRKDMQGQDVGSRLLMQSLAALREDGIEGVELTVSPDNANALWVYRDQLGFSIRSQRLDEYGEGEHRLVMSKDL